MVSAKYRGEIVRKVRSYFADKVLRLLYFLKKNRYGQRRIIMDYKIWIAMVVLGEKSEYAIAHLHCSQKEVFHRFFSPPHSHQKALPFGNLRGQRCSF